MSDRVIGLLQPTDFRIFKAWVSQGNVTPVFIASFATADGLQDVYGKIYPFTDTDRSVFNEIVGYLTAHALAIPQPSRAYIALMATKDILANHQDTCVANTLQMAC